MRVPQHIERALQQYDGMYRVVHADDQCTYGTSSDVLHVALSRDVAVLWLPDPLRFGGHSLHYPCGARYFVIVFLALFASRATRARQFPREWTKMPRTRVVVLFIRIIYTFILSQLLCTKHVANQN